MSALAGTAPSVAVAPSEVPPVLFVIPGEGTGSSMIFARRQAEQLRSMQVSVALFHLRSRTSPLALLQELRRFRQTLRILRPGVVHAHFGTMTGLFAAIAAPATPLVITYRGSDLNDSPWSRSYRARLGRWFSQIAALRARRIVCVSQRLQERLWWRRERVTVLPSGVDTNVFQPHSRDDARASLGWPAEERVILFNAGHDPRNKRLDLARAAAREAERWLPRVRLHVLDGRVDPAKIPLLMNASDCLLVTSDSEGSPTVVQEALACNLPIVSVPVGDVPERLEGVLHTRIVPRDPQELGSALAELIREPLRTNGRERAAEICAARIASELCRLYREARG